MENYFLDHFKAPIADSIPVEPHDQVSDSVVDEESSIDEWTNKFNASKAARRVLLRKLSELAGVDYQVASPREIQKAINLAYFGGESRERWKQKGNRIPPGAAEFEMEYSRLNREVANAKRMIQAIKPRSSGRYAMAVRRLAILLGDVSEPLSHAYSAITGDTWVRRIEVRFGHTGELSIDFSLTTESGLEVDPQTVFSEGKQDLLALLFFLEVARAAARRGQAKVLILDDVLQSVDSTVRVNLIDWLLKELHDWQLLLTVHDRAWRAQLTNLMNKNGHNFIEKEIRSWSFKGGPRLLSDIGDTSALSNALESGSHHSVAVEAGRLLEQIADRLSWTLPVAVQRAQGDKYDLGALWPPLLKKLSKTSLKQVVADIDRNILLRNLLGAHYNEWAQSISAADADFFGRAVLSLHSDVFCADCRQWLVPNRAGPPWACPCGGTTVVSDSVNTSS